MNHEVYRLADHVRRTTDFARMSRESDEDAAHRAEGLVVALLFSWIATLVLAALVAAGGM